MWIFPHTSCFIVGESVIQSVINHCVHVVVFLLLFPALLIRESDNTVAKHDMFNESKLTFFQNSLDAILRIILDYSVWTKASK